MAHDTGTYNEYRDLTSETNKRLREDHSRFKVCADTGTNKAQSHSLGDTPQQSQVTHQACYPSEMESKDLIPGLTTCESSTSSSSSVDKSESPEEDNSETKLGQPLRSNNHMVGNAMYQVNLRYQGQNTDLPVLPSLGKDSIVQRAFTTNEERDFQPHDGRYHGLNSSVYMEDQAWRQDPGAIHDFQDFVNEGMARDAQLRLDKAAEISTDQYKTTRNVEVSAAERPYHCTFENCNWSFLRSSDQKRHIRSHKKPLLRCPYWEFDQSCHRNSGAFNRRDVLKRHLKLMHFNQGVNSERGQCKHCNLQFSSLKYFFEHCDLCAANLVSLSKLTIEPVTGADQLATSPLQ